MALDKVANLPDQQRSFSRLQKQVDEVVDVMQDNIGKVMDRGDKLEDLHDKSGTVHVQLKGNLLSVIFNLKAVLIMLKPT